MTNLSKKFLYALFSLLVFTNRMIGQAPASSDSPYSDQRFATPGDPAWYEAPSIWIALLLLIVVLVVLRMRKKQEHYT